MQLLSTLPSRLPSWFREFLGPLELDTTAAVHELRFDEWPEDSSGAIEGKRTVLPAKFRFGQAGSKSVTLRPDGPLTLTCVLGALWVTKDQDNTDYVLSAGESLEVETGRSIVVFALQFGLLVVEPTAPH
jgi:hypothetical protein